MGAIIDEIARSGADDILVATLPRARSNWLRNRVVERLDQATDVKVTAIVVDLRLQVTVEPPDEWDQAVVTVPSLEELHRFLKDCLEEHVAEPDERGRIMIGIVEAPEETAAMIRAKVARRRDKEDGRKWIGVAVTTADDS